MRATLLVLLALILLLPAKGPTVQADEGMWLLNVPPTKILADRHKFALTDAWLDRAMKASVRFTNGGSGGFVSDTGLVVTNHHIGATSIQKLSTAKNNYLRDGFLAKTPAAELKCPDLELNVLQEIIDVTARVNAAVKPGTTDAQAAAARRAIIAAIQDESTEKTKLRSDVVTLYQGGAFHLYRYKKYTDVRLVFAPEQDIAFFGGDNDNFEYPRFNLDVCFFRVYEDDKPVKPAHFFPWSKAGPAENDLVFVTGHPGTTNRQDTFAMLKHRRDLTLPYTLTRLRYLEALLYQFGQQGPEEARQAARESHRVSNARKALTGQYQGLLTPSVMAAKEQSEKEFRKKVKADPKLEETTGDAWKRIAAAQKSFASFEQMFYLLERGDAFDSELFPIARHLVRLAVERPKKSEDRLTEYGKARLESLEFQMFSPAPIAAPLERARLAGAFSFLAEQLGGEHPLVTKVLAGKSPADRAAELVGGTKLFDPVVRKALAKGDAATKSDDPLLVLARLIDDEARALRKRHEEEVVEPMRQAMGAIARAKFALLGTDVAPDATFTLRLAFGTVRGYDVDGQTLPYTTTFGGAFDRAEKMSHKDPFVLPPSWMKSKEKLAADTPFNFASTSDTIGGNSGSPVLNREGELVGVNFDRNRHGLVRNFVYTDVQARHISVHSRGVLEALRKVYGATGLVKELTGK